MAASSSQPTETKAYLAWASVNPISVSFWILAFSKAAGLAYLSVHSLHTEVSGRILREYLLGLFDEGLVVFLILLGDNGVLRIVRFGATHQSLDTEQSSSDTQSWTPLGLENVQTDSSSHGTHIRVPNFSVEFHLTKSTTVCLLSYLWRCVWIVAADLDVDAELAFFVWGIGLGEGLD